MNQRTGFTLIELMVVIAIIAILAAVALPLYTEQVRKSYRREAQATLLRIAQLQERYYTVNNTYQDVGGFPTLLGLPGGAAVYSGERPSDPTGKYQITLGVGTGAGCAAITCGYILTAAPNAAANHTDPKCANFTLSSTGARGFTGTGTTKDCW